MMSLLTSLISAACLIPLALSSLVLRPEGYLKLPTFAGTEVFNSGTANRAAYDAQSNLLYVIGHKADVMNVINMKDSLTNPVLARTIQFDALNQGLPNDIKVCRGNLPSLNFLAISFESKDLTERGHVHFYQLLEQPQDAFIRLKNVATVEGFDPRSMAWNTLCTELVVVSTGVVHTINNAFEDPTPALDVLLPKIGLNVDRRSMPFSENAVKSAGVRQVFSKCDSGTYTGQATHVQDLEPTHVVVDSDNIAYVFFQSNNAMGKMDLTDPFVPMTYHNMGKKDWSKYTVDTSYEDGGIKPMPHHIMSLYQPGHAVTFKLGNKTYIATADTGSIRSYNVRPANTYLCRFEESTVGSTWRTSNEFSSFVTPEMATELKNNMSTVTKFMNFCRLKSIQDGYNPLQMGYNYLTTYGGRGWSLLDTTDMSRVYDSGDVMESNFLSPDIKDAERSMFNAYYASSNQPQSQTMDRTSPLYGPYPTAIATGNINGTQGVVVANGYVGGLYLFSVTLNDTVPDPDVSFEGFQRRGSPGLTWDQAYKRPDDSVGEPSITDLIWIEDEGQHVVVAISSLAGAASFYSVELQP